MASIYSINKGINKPIEFKGLKAQYIGYLAIGLVILLVLFATMYIIGINLLVCILIISAAGTTLFMTVYRLSYKYGEYGLLKKGVKCVVYGEVCFIAWDTCPPDLRSTIRPRQRNELNSYPFPKDFYR